jgi:sugar/nucleoside kinase (ribokinase family)
VQTHLVEDTKRPLVIKRRYVDPFQNVKMFEICWLDGDGPSPEAEDQMLEQLESLVPQHDMVIVADFGHSGIGSRTIEWLSQQNSYLAVNVQTNSANAGYNLITKYPRADYMCLDEEEIRLANQSLYGSLTNIAMNTAQDLHCEVASVTLGSKGAMTFRHDQDPVFTPIFSTDVVDSVGAGDAFLSITSLCARAGYPSDLIGFIGNCVGAIAVRIVGNREPVGANQLFSFINALLK